MRNVSTPYRSVLYTPGSNENALKKSVGLSADGLIIDLEDSVVQSQKDFARELVCKFLKSSLAQFKLKRKKIAVRINSLYLEFTEYSSSLSSLSLIELIIFLNIDKFSLMSSISPEAGPDMMCRADRWAFW